MNQWEFAVTNRFQSDAFILFTNQLQFRDQNLLNWFVARPSAATVTPRFRGRTFWFGQSRVFTQTLYGGVRITPRPFAWVEPVIGAAWDQRPGAPQPDGTSPLRTDAGPALGARLYYEPPPKPTYRVRLLGDGAWQAITPRRGYHARVAGFAERLFETTRLASRLRMASVRRDTYQAVSILNRDTPPSETIEATTSDTLEVGVDLEMPVYRRLRLTSRLDFTINNRFIRGPRASEEVLFFETDFNRRAIDAEVALLYTKQQVTARLALQGSATTEERQLANRDALPPAEAAQKINLLRQADYDEGAFGLIANLRSPIGRRAVVTFDGSSRILRHDTPEVNRDDRDEIYHNAELGAIFFLSRYLEMDVKMFGSFYHTVYLKAERSAENTKQRSLRLRPTIRWKPSPRTRIRVGTEVRATYTVDDFVLPGRRPSDQSAREIRYAAEVEHDLPSGPRLMATGSYSDLRLGRLLWGDFAEIPFDTLRTYSAWLHVQTGQRIIADVGLRIFIRTDFDRSTSVRYRRLDAAGNVLRDENGQVLTGRISRPGRQWIEQIGPTASIMWSMNGASMVRLDGWLNVQHIRWQLYGDLPEASADEIIRAAERGTRKVIPNLLLTVVWNF